MKWRHFPVAGALALLLAAAGGAQTPRDATLRFEEPFVRSAQEEPRQDEAKWPAALHSNCRGSVRASGPVVCIRRIGGSSYRRGDPITAEIDWRSADNMFLVVAWSMTRPRTRIISARGAPSRRCLPCPPPAAR